LWIFSNFSFRRTPIFPATALIFFSRCTLLLSALKQNFRATLQTSVPFSSSLHRPPLLGLRGLASCGNFLNCSLVASIFFSRCTQIFLSLHSIFFLSLRVSIVSSQTKFTGHSSHLHTFFIFATSPAIIRFAVPHSCGYFPIFLLAALNFFQPLRSFFSAATHFFSTLKQNFRTTLHASIPFSSSLHRPPLLGLRDLAPCGNFLNCSLVALNFYSRCTFYFQPSNKISALPLHASTPFLSLLHRPSPLGLLGVVLVDNSQNFSRYIHFFPASARFYFQHLSKNSAMCFCLAALLIFLHCPSLLGLRGITLAEIS
jgi:hypothetical protein